MWFETVKILRVLATSNYVTTFPADSQLAERVIFPAGPNETRGMEDARFVRFTDDGRQMTYYATYTAYDGRSILPQLIETDDFVRFTHLHAERRGGAEQGHGAVPAHDRRQVRRCCRARIARTLAPVRPRPTCTTGATVVELLPPATSVGAAADRQLRLADRDRGRVGSCSRTAWDRCAATPSVRYCSTSTIRNA